MNALCLDLGLKRIGVALCVDAKIALPLRAVLRKNARQAVAEIRAILEEHKITSLIIGVPRGGKSEEEMKKRADHFVALLGFEGKIHFVDESFTSKEAVLLRNKNTRKKDGTLDSLAALLMIREFFGLF